jgi:hypothetical protein
MINGCALVVPAKSLTPIAFPERDQPFPPDAAAHLALPEASEVRTYPSEAHERILRPWNDQVPATTSFSPEVGACPIPTLVPEKMKSPVPVVGVR